MLLYPNNPTTMLTFRPPVSLAPVFFSHVHAYSTLLPMQYSTFPGPTCHRAGVRTGTVRVGFSQASSTPETRKATTTTQFGLNGSGFELPDPLSPPLITSPRLGSNQEGIQAKPKVAHFSASRCSCFASLLQFSSSSSSFLGGCSGSDSGEPSRSWYGGGSEVAPFPTVSWLSAPIGESWVFLFSFFFWFRDQRSSELVEVLISARLMSLPLSISFWFSPKTCVA